MHQHSGMKNIQIFWTIYFHNSPIVPYPTPHQNGKYFNMVFTPPIYKSSLLVLFIYSLKNSSVSQSLLKPLLGICLIFSVANVTLLSTWQHNGSCWQMLITCVGFLFPTFLALNLQSKQKVGGRRGEGIFPEIAEQLYLWMSWEARRRKESK